MPDMIFFLKISRFLLKAPPILRATEAKNFGVSLKCLFLLICISNYLSKPVNSTSILPHVLPFFHYDCTLLDKVLSLSHLLTPHTHIHLSYYKN